MLVRITIDDQEYAVDHGKTVFQAARENNIDIPGLCTDETTCISGACRLCIVEIDGYEKPQTSCSTYVKEGMVVRTGTEKIIEMRHHLVQLLLDSHPNDCATCQSTGVCALQKYAAKYRAKFRTLDKAERRKYEDTSSPYIVRNTEKCILCGKCVDTCNQVESRSVMTFKGRGYDMEVTLDFDKEFADSKCVSCNRCVAVCPVGALEDRRLMNKMRSFQGQRRTIPCRACGYGCEYELHTNKAGEKVAVTAKPPAKDRPLCLNGRLMTEMVQVDKDYLEKPYMKRVGKFVEATWTQATGLTATIKKVQELDGDE